MIPAIAGLNAPARTAASGAKDSAAPGFEDRLTSVSQAPEPRSPAPPAAQKPVTEAQDGATAGASADPAALPAEADPTLGSEAMDRAALEEAAARPEAALLPEFPASDLQADPAAAQPALPSTPLVEALRVSLSPADEAEAEALPDALAEPAADEAELPLEAKGALPADPMFLAAAAPIAPAALAGAGQDMAAPDGIAMEEPLPEVEVSAPAARPTAEPSRAAANPGAAAQPAPSGAAETADVTFADLTTEALGAPASGATRPSQSAAPAAAPAAPSPAQPEERPTPPLLRNVLDRLSEIEIAEGKTRLLLRPQGLGVLEIDLARMVDGRLHLAIRAENPLLLEALKQDGSALASFMSERGFDLSGGQPDLERYSPPTAEADAEGAERAETSAEASPVSTPAQPLLRADRLDLLT